MVPVRRTLLILFLLQLSTYVFSASNVTEEAQLALKSLSDQIESSSKLVSATIPNVWNSYIISIEETIAESLSSDIGNHTELLHNLTEFANILSNREECVAYFVNVYLSNNNGINMLENEQQVYENFRDLAKLEVNYVLNHYKDLEMEFNESCIVNRNNCNGTSKFVISEVERLMLIAGRIPYDFLSETHLLGYRLEADWAASQATTNIEFNEAIQITTTCLALKFENYRIESLGVDKDIPKNVEESVFDDYMKLLHRAEDTFKDSINDFTSYSLNVIDVVSAEYDSTVIEIENTITRANKTVNALIDFAQDNNIDIDDCPKPNLNSIQAVALIRGLEEYFSYLDTGSYIDKEGLDYLSVTLNEIDTIYLQVTKCSSTVDCSSLSEKLSDKMTEIPSLLQGRGNGTAVLQSQAVAGTRESGYKIIRDGLDQLEASIVYLKDCIRNQLY